MKSKIVCLSVFCAMAMSPMANAEGVAGKWMLAPTPETHDKGQIREILKLELSGTKEIKGTAKRSDNSTFGDVKGEVDKADVKLEIKKANASNSASGASGDEEKNKVKLQGKIDGNTVKLADKDGGQYLMERDLQDQGVKIH